eukprot:CAMPEP_0179210208 /NCGR_PEP_ID=MMETSP0796-20121207/104841_1 /TAXON_ID=73915 /ORGANISM="Pyrodinium bahamense, Strain pbaha01" /LENGTH=785 /DNA_ID=CAMNT_0020915171 /DNA_START=42 /DNA_END=2399 /DNA_ORIENTATION=+
MHQPALVAMPALWRCATWLIFMVAFLPELEAHAVDAQVSEARQTLGCNLLSLDSKMVRFMPGDVDEEKPRAKAPGSPPGREVEQQAARGPRGLMHDRAALLNLGSQRRAASAGAAANGGKQQGPLSAGWFGDFSQDESTYRTDGIDAGWDYPEKWAKEADYFPSSGEDVVTMPTAKPDKWFQETESAGKERAWQTYFPGIGNFHHRDQHLLPWHNTRTGTFQETYEPDSKVERAYEMTKAKTAAWFDSSVNQYDAFGRGKLPSPESKERYLEWSQRSRNTTLACAAPGCEVNAILKVFDGAVEEHEQCKLTVAVHPTDFDDEFSREYVELVQLNGRALRFRCHPQGRARACGVGGDEALRPCLEDFSLDGFVGKDGLLNITGRISPMVDECPVDGNLLSGVVIVNCLVHPTWLARPAGSNKVAEAVHWHKRETASPMNAMAKLQCREPGCVASTALLLSDKDIVNKTCRLTVTVAQTDFDGNHGSNEEVEWLKVDGNITKEHMKPGGNPCKGQARALTQAHSQAATGANASNGGSSSSSKSIDTSGSKSTDNSKSSGNSRSGDGSKSSSGNSSNSSGSRNSSSESSSMNSSNSSSNDTKSGAAASNDAGNASTGLLATVEGQAGGGFFHTVASNASAAVVGNNASGAGAGNATGAAAAAGHASSAVAGGATNFTAAGSSAAGSAAAGSAATGAGNSTAQPNGTADAAAAAALTAQLVGAGLHEAAAANASNDADDVERYVLVDGSDVTEAARDGRVEVSAKISGMVDECGSNGFLLDAEAVVVCE